MDYEKQELAILEMLEPLRQLKPPQSLMKNFEEEVFLKISRQGAGPGLPMALGAVLAIAFVGMLVWFFTAEMAPLQPVKLSEIASRPSAARNDIIANTAAEEFVQQGRPNGQPVIARRPPETDDEAISTPTPALSKTASENAPTDDDLMIILSDDLFILEMLGEDEGLVNDIAYMEAYTELLPTVQV